MTKLRLREPTDEEMEIMEAHNMRAENYYVIEGDSDKCQLVCLHKRRSRRRTIKL